MTHLKGVVNCARTLIRKSERKRKLARLRHRWEDNVTNFKQLELKGEDCYKNGN
jgi:hypothetical protein